MATDYAGWVASKRHQLGLSQAALARVVSRILGEDVTRDAIWTLERGSPRYPRPEFTMALAEALGRPLAEALEALGYKMPPNRSARIAPELLDALEPLSLPSQKALAQMLPRLMELSEYVARPTPSLRRVAEPGERYGRRGRRKGEAEPAQP